LRSKPAHLGPEYADQFQDRAIIDAYHHRPPYPPEVFGILTGLITGEPRDVLDAGCGTGDIARGLAPLVRRVDAVDISPGMLEKGYRQPGGDHPNLCWIHARVEDAELRPPYALVTAGESLHWMDWQVVLPIFGRVLMPEGYVAIIGREEVLSPWHEELKTLIARYSTNREYRPYDLIGELETRGLFSVQGAKKTLPLTSVQSIDSYIESIHSRNGFSRERMTKRNASAFDAEVRELLSCWSKDGNLEVQTAGVIVWGLPVRDKRNR